MGGMFTQVLGSPLSAVAYSPKCLEEVFSESPHQAIVATKGVTFTDRKCPEYHIVRVSNPSKSPEMLGKAIRRKSAHLQGICKHQKRRAK